jgi:hypothetical protein
MPLYIKNCDAIVDGANPSLLIMADIMQSVTELIDKATDADVENVNEKLEEKAKERNETDENTGA